MIDIKRRLTVYVILALLVGCAGKQSLNEKQGSDAVQGVGTTKSINHSLPKSEPPKPSAQDKILLNVPLIDQNPELKYGCEVTSLAMVLQYAGIKVNKTELANRIKKENEPMMIQKDGNIVNWGDPKDGFVGDITGKKRGYAVYVRPLQELMERYLPGRTINLTGKSFDDVLSQIKKGKPVVVWTTGNYRLPGRWESWKHGKEQINATLDLHAVVLVGFEPGYVYVNDPLAVKKGYRVNRQTFIQSWNALGKQALSYR